MGGRQPIHAFPFLCNCQAIPRLAITVGYRMLTKVLEASLSQKWSFKQNCINSVILVIK